MAFLDLTGKVPAAHSAIRRETADGAIKNRVGKPPFENYPSFLRIPPLPLQFPLPLSRNFDQTLLFSKESLRLLLNSPSYIHNL